MKRPRRRIKGLSMISKVSVIVITTLNLLGVSYAQWNEDLNIDTIVSTGEIKPYFKNVVVPESPFADLDAYVVDNGKTLLILGKVGRFYAKEITFQIGNKGKLPIETEPQYIDIHGSGTSLIYSEIGDNNIPSDESSGDEPDGLVGFSIRNLAQKEYDITGDIIVKQSK